MLFISTGFSEPTPQRKERHSNRNTKKSNTTDTNKNFEEKLQHTKEITQAQVKKIEIKNQLQMQAPMSLIKTQVDRMV